MRLSGDLYGESHGRIDLALFGGTVEKIYLWQGCGCMETGSDYCIRCYPSLEAHRQDVEDRLLICSSDLKEFKGNSKCSIQREIFQKVVIPWMDRREEKMNLHIQHIYTVNYGQGLEQRISFCGHPWGRTKEFYYYCRMKHIRFFFETSDKTECVYYEEPNG